MKHPKHGQQTHVAIAVVVALVVIILSSLVASFAHAQGVPADSLPQNPPPPASYSWTDPIRLSFGVGGGYVWHTGEEANLPSTRKEFEIGGFGAYNIVPDFSIAGYLVRGFENRTWRSGAGPRLTVWRSNDNQHAASVSLRYAWHTGPDGELPRFRHEWEAGAEYGFRFSSRVTLGASSAYGLDNHTFRSAVGARYLLF